MSVAALLFEICCDSDSATGLSPAHQPGSRSCIATLLGHAATGSGTLRTPGKPSLLRPGGSRCTRQQPPPGPTATTGPSSSGPSRSPGVSPGGRAAITFSYCFNCRGGSVPPPTRSRVRPRPGLWVRWILQATSIGRLSSPLRTLGCPTDGPVLAAPNNSGQRLSTQIWWRLPF
ncbi:hypothetical protein NDU88_006651 [Pleurodeles waltl]|uniref:Uncharacterized protein n=1 Tax=Pleurodeles waltl TaxID=8319 RepID=A0AAV7NZY8_PLEWA|nr:hypothetical protein NDU88_006651 [Pleurodeles waltl]